MDSFTSPPPATRHEIGVHRYLLHRPDDVAALREDIRTGVVSADSVVAVTGKTEGAGGPNDASRGAIDGAIRRVLDDTGTRPQAAVAAIPMNFSGGSGGVISPHVVVFTSTPAAEDAPTAGDGRLALGFGVSAPIAPEHIGRLAMVDAVADAVRAAAASAGVPVDAVTYAMAKNPMLTQALVDDAARRGETTIDPTGLRALFRTSGATALGVATALGDLRVDDDARIGTDHTLWSSRASASSGVESDRAQVILFANGAQAVGRYRVGRATMTDALDVSALHRAARDAGLDVTDFADPRTFASRIATIYVKANSTIDGTLRGFPQVQDGYEDRAYTTELKASVGGMFAAALGDPAFYISAAGVHQGPPGGGSVVVIADVGA